MRVARVLAVLLLLPAICAAQSPVTALAYAPDGQHLLIGSQDGVEVCRRPELSTVRKLDVELLHVHDLAFAPNGQLLAIAGGRPGDSGEVVLCHWPSGQIVWRRIAHDDLIYRVTWNAQGTQLATAGGDRKVLTLAAASGHIQQTLAGHSRPVLGVCFLPGGTQLVSAGADRSLRVWDTSSATLLRQLDHHTDEVRAVALRPATTGLPMLVSAGADHTIRFWQPTIGRLVRFVKLPVEPLCVAWLPSGQHAVAGCVDGNVRWIDHETLEILDDRPAIDGWAYEIAADPTGQSIAVGGSNHQVIELRDIVASATHP